VAHGAQVVGRAGGEKLVGGPDLVGFDCHRGKRNAIAFRADQA
jgi:hypothetical protein